MPEFTQKWNANEQNIDVPLRWRKPRIVRITADLFHETVPDEWIDRVFAVMALAPQHQFQVLTKRSKRMREYYVSRDIKEFRWRADQEIAIPLGLNVRAPDVWPLPNVWLGVSVEDQARAAARIPDLLATPAAVRWISAEPLLGPVDLRAHFLNPHGFTETPRWVVVGGESGPGSRPMHPDWARSLRDQCAAAGVPFLFKQWGDWSPVRIEGEDNGHLEPAYPMSGCSESDTHRSSQQCRFWQDEELVTWPHVTTLPAIGARRIGKQAAGRLLDGVEHNGYPEARS